MRLMPLARRAAGRLGRALPFALPLALAAVFAGDAGAQPAPTEQPPNSNDILGNIVVVAGATRPLPKIAVLPSLASDMEDVTLRAVMRRDLDLCGEFQVLPDSAAPEGLYLADSPIDVGAWRGKGAEALVKVSGKHVSDAKAELRAQVILLARGDKPVFEKQEVVDPKQARVEAHRLADLVIGALTGQNGSFASHMTFSSGTGRNRRVYTIDADGNDAKAVSPDDRVAIAAAFGKGEQLHYIASKNHDEYAVYPLGSDQRLPQPVKGSVYSIVWSKDRSKVAASIAQGDTIHVFLGPDLASAKPASPIAMAIDPTFTPSGKLAFAGAGRWGQRIYVEGKPISPDGVMASAPTFCNNPDGVRAVFAVGVGKDTDLVATGENGGGLVRLTQNQGRNGYPACSPDGRLVAFFSTRKGDEGPGLYVMRLDGGHPRRISSLLGDSLRWDPLPPPAQPNTTAAK